MNRRISGFIGLVAATVTLLIGAQVAQADPTYPTIVSPNATDYVGYQSPELSFIPNDSGHSIEWFICRGTLPDEKPPACFLAEPSVRSGYVDSAGVGVKVTSTTPPELKPEVKYWIKVRSVTKSGDTYTPTSEWTSGVIFTTAWFGTANADTITGDDDANKIWTFDGDDLVKGGASADLIYTEGGNDMVDGESGNDTIHGGTGDDELTGYRGHDNLFGEDGDDRMFGGSANDFIVGGPGEDRMYGAAGKDNMHGGDDDDYMFGGAGNDNLDGGGGIDYLKGSDGFDSFSGGEGDDLIDAKEGSNNAQFGGGQRAKKSKYRDKISCGAGIDKVYSDKKDRIAKDCEFVNGRRKN